MRPEDVRPGDADRLRQSIWHRRARLLGYVILAVVTVYGIREFAQGDWGTVTAYWANELPWVR